MDTTTTLAPPPFVSEVWASLPTVDAYQQMYGREAKDWSLLRLVLAASLTVLALGIIVAVHP